MLCLNVDISSSRWCSGSTQERSSTDSSPAAPERLFWFFDLTSRSFHADFSPLLFSPSPKYPTGLSRNICDVLDIPYGLQIFISDNPTTYVFLLVLHSTNYDIITTPITCDPSRNPDTIPMQAIECSMLTTSNKEMPLWTFTPYCRCHRFTTNPFVSFFPFSSRTRSRGRGTFEPNRLFSFVFAWVRAYFFLWMTGTITIQLSRGSSGRAPLLRACRTVVVVVRGYPHASVDRVPFVTFFLPLFLVHLFLVFCDCSVNIWLMLGAPCLVRAVVKAL